jgi:hypothetical protein
MKKQILSQTLQNLLFPRSRAIFMPLTSPSTLRRNSSFRYSFGSRPQPSRHRSQAPLERSKTPAHSWDQFRKSDHRMMSYAGLNEDTRRHLWRGGVGDGINRCVIWRNIVVLYWTQNLTPSHNHILYMPPSYYSPLP